MVDSFLKWPEVMKCKNPTRSHTIRFLHDIFTRFGIPDTIVSDNGTQFTTKILKDFCKAFSILHIITAPYHPQPNGQAERFMNSFKRALKSQMEIRFLSVYSVTSNPSTNSGLSPAELMFVRKIRSVFNNLLPKEN